MSNESKAPTAPDMEAAAREIREYLPLAQASASVHVAEGEAGESPQTLRTAAKCLQTLLSRPRDYIDEQVVLSVAADIERMAILYTRPTPAGYKLMPKASALRPFRCWTFSCVAMGRSTTDERCDCGLSAIKAGL